MTNRFSLLPPQILIENVGPLLGPNDLSKFAIVLKFKITERMPEKVERLIRTRLQTLLGAINVHTANRIWPVNEALWSFAYSLAGLPAQFHKDYTVVHMCTWIPREYSQLHDHMLGDLHGGRGMSHTVIARMSMYLAYGPRGGVPTTHSLRYIRLSWTDGRMEFDSLKYGFDLMTGNLPRATNLDDVLWVEE